MGYPHEDHERERAPEYEQERVPEHEPLTTLDAILAAAPTGFAYLDHDLRFARVNESLARMDGVPVAEHLGRTPSEALPGLGAVLEPVLRRTMATGEALAEVKLEALPPANSTVDRHVWQVSCFPVRMDGLSPRGIGAFVTDVTAREAAQASLVESEARLRAVLNTVLDGIITIDDRGVIQSFNPMAERIFGYLAAEVIGRDVSVLMPEPYHSEHASYIGNYLRTGKPKIIGIGREVVGRRKDGSTFPLDLAVSEVHVDAHRLFTGVVRDITERKRAEEMILQQARDLSETVAELEQFAYVASHDLQEPLRMVSSYVQLLARRYRGQLDPDADEFIGFAVDGATRMQQLINDLLAYSRVGTRARPLQPVSFEAVLAGVLANLQVAISESRAVVTHDPLPEVLGDATQLGQLFQNLIGNAIKFRGGAEPRVHVSAKERRADWLFSVQDNGIGIDPQYAERVFLIFQRLHSRAEYPGTGIGLAISKKIVERHGGRIWVESAPGKGSTFYFNVPKKGGRHDQP